MIRYTDFSPKNSTRRREDIEWSIFYSFNASDETSPRVLTVGDSICFQYRDLLREKLADKVNITSWATSKCVTDVTYLKDFEHVLEYNRYDLVTFNNGLHFLSGTAPAEEWEQAFRQTLEYLSAKIPGIPVMVVLCTPVNNAEKNLTVRKLNAAARKTAAELNLPVIDLYAEMDKLDRSVCWSDEFHFKESAKELQARIMADHISGKLDKAISRGNKLLRQKSSMTGPDGAIKSGNQ